MGNPLQNITTSALADIASFFGIPGVSTAKALWEHLQEKRLSKARDILFEEIEQGNFNGIPEDELISILYRYAQASANGTAKVNLRILAKLITGLLKDENLLPSLYASEFNRYSNILADLSYEEIQILATLYRFKLQNEKEEQMTGFQTAVSLHMPDTRDYYEKAKDWLSGQTIHIKKGVGRVVEERGPKIISAEEFEATVSALARTGLVYSPVIGLISGSGAPRWQLTPLFFKIINLADFQSALDKAAQENSN